MRWIAGREPSRSRAGALLIAAVSERNNTKSGLYANGRSGHHARENEKLYLLPAPGTKELAATIEDYTSESKTLI
jgi:hypothetical protein